MKPLPKAFQQRMQMLLGTEYKAFEACFSQNGHRGIRINPLKAEVSVVQKSLSFPLKPSPFSVFGYYIPTEIEHIGTLPLHHAGAFYVQEPSASSAVTILDPSPGDKVLDLCAAPGGKSTQIAGMLQGKGLLWSNEYVRSRANILLSNLERLGVANVVLSSSHPEPLCQKLSGYFDKVLVDAPCSGEGMFLHDDGAIDAWSPSHVASCAVRQQEILASAAVAVKPGGVMVYSTCTYAVEENEQVIMAFLQQHPEFILLDCDVSFGRASQLLPKTRRIFPMDGGDGHFIAKLQKTEGESYLGKLWVPPKKITEEVKIGQAFLQETTRNRINGTPMVENRKDAVYWIPEELPELDGGNVIRAGILLGNIKKGRIQPAHHFFMTRKPEQLYSVVNLSSEQEQIARYLRGEEIPVFGDLHGYTGVSVDGVMVGFGKCSNGTMKNHYPKGLRNLR